MSCSSRQLKRTVVNFLLIVLSYPLCLLASITQAQQNSSETVIIPTNSFVNVKSIIQQVDGHWATSRFKTREKNVLTFLLPLGSMKKVRGAWQPERFELINGYLRRLTWRVRGEPINVLYASIMNLLARSAEERWACVGRSCGNAAEWASRIYQESLLYGRDEFMNYQAFQLQDGTWLTLFSAARTADRQYLHLDIIYPK